MKESIENRIEEIENYYESHFDESFVLNYENGILKLKNLLIQNIPNCVNICNDWIWTWAAKGWVRSKGKKIENLEVDFVQKIYTPLPF